jgi:hypothetical protein
MRLLPTELSMNGLWLKQVKRNDKKALYSVQLEPKGLITGYEVWDVVSNTKTELLPNNEDFGKTAWSWCSLEQAEKQFN